MSILVSDPTTPDVAAPCNSRNRPHPETKAADGWLDSAPFRAHVLHLMSTSGLTMHELAALTQVSAGVIRRLLHGRAGRVSRRIDALSARRLFAVTPLEASLVRSQQVAAGRARARLLILMDLGRTPASLARLTGLAVADVTRLAAGRLTTCAQLVELRLSAALAELDATGAEADDAATTSSTAELVDAA